MPDAQCVARCGMIKSSHHWVKKEKEEEEKNEGEVSCLRQLMYTVYFWKEMYCSVISEDKEY